MAKNSIEIVAGKNIINNMRNIPKNMNNILGRVIDPPIKKELNAYKVKHFGDYPGAANSPVIWESEKQRRAYFASDGFGRGIPTRRSGNYKRQQVVKANRRALEAGIYNEHEAAQFLTGGRQSRQHAATGYPRYKEHETSVLESVAPVAERAIVSEIKRDLLKR